MCGVRVFKGDGWQWGVKRCGGVGGRETHAVLRRHTIRLSRLSAWLCLGSTHGEPHVRETNPEEHAGLVESVYSRHVNTDRDMECNTSM